MAPKRNETWIAHFNARVRAMKSLLFDRDRYDDLLEQEDLGVLVEVLLNSPYEQDMAEALTRYQGADAVEEAVARNLTRTFEKLVTLAENCFQDRFRLFLLRWDLTAAKDLLRKRHHDARAHAHLARPCPGPTLTIPILADLAERDTMESLIGGLVMFHPALFQCLGTVYADYMRFRDLAVLEDALDHAYFVDLARELGQARDDDARDLCQFLRMCIDRINLLALFQLKAHRAQAASVETRILPEGTLSRTVLHTMAAAERPEEVMEAVGATAYQELIEGLYLYVQTKRLGPLDRLFDLFFITALRRMARRHALGLAVVMSYLWLKHNEAMNLRMLARGEARHLPRGRVREELIYA